MKNNGYRLLVEIHGYKFYLLNDLQERFPKGGTSPFTEIELVVEEHNLLIEELVKDFLKNRTL